MRLPILCYHRVGPEQEEGRRLNVEPNTLDEHVRYFARRSAVFLTAPRWQDAWRHRAVWLTFDDAYESALTHGGDVLVRHGATASFYAVADLVGGESSWDAQGTSRLASWEALRDAQTRGFEIGNHTFRHEAMGGLGQDEQVASWTRARATFDAEGIATYSACLPYGSWNEFTDGAVQAAGYSLCLALSRRLARRRDAPLRLPRIVVAYSDRLPMLLYKMHIRPWLPRFRSRPHYVP